MLVWRHVLWLGVLIGVLYLSAFSPPWRDSPARGFVTVLIGVLFFWWSQRLLHDELPRRPGRRREP
ncbi:MULTISPECIES: hypothetical protein [unclassified Streptomyces]|uniref:hypothetical protein n=1 Tax=Streptomyces sp. NBC_00291 TaxID=2975704 RepID=UPI00225786CF|nr:hypothetical protein [Streptomyces sp. NBC_00291]MCX5157308.1 hypothetical protein [Streptomyces sp. NBC_00291]